MGNEGYVRVSAYCLNCKKRREMLDIEIKKVKIKGIYQKQATGLCTICGKKIVKLVQTS